MDPSILGASAGRPAMTDWRDGEVLPQQPRQRKGALMIFHIFWIFPKKYFLELSSTPKILKPFFEKKIEDSDPTNPHDPVINA